MAKKTEKLSLREKLSVHLIIIGLKIIGAWEYDHQIDKYFEALEKDMKLGE